MTDSPVNVVDAAVDWHLLKAMLIALIGSRALPMPDTVGGLKPSVSFRWMGSWLGICQNALLTGILRAVLNCINSLVGKNRLNICSSVASHLVAPPVLEASLLYIISMTAAPTFCI